MFSGMVILSFQAAFSTTFLKIVVEVMTYGLLTFCKLWYGVSKGILPVKDLAPKILMAVDNCRHQLARRLRWVAPTYLKKEGATPHLGVCKHSSQYDRRPDTCLGVRVGMWNIGSLNGKGEICEELRKRLIGVY